MVKESPLSSNITIRTALGFGWIYPSVLKWKCNSYAWKAAVSCWRGNNPGHLCQGQQRPTWHLNIHQTDSSRWTQTCQTLVCVSLLGVVGACMSFLFTVDRDLNSTQPNFGFLLKASWSGFNFFDFSSFSSLLRLFFLFLSLTHSRCWRVHLPGEES